MAKRSIEGSTLTAIANATRNLTGQTGLLTPEQITSLLQTEIDSGKVALEMAKLSFASNWDNYIDTSFISLSVTYMNANGEFTVNTSCHCGDGSYVLVPKNTIVHIASNELAEDMFIIDRKLSPDAFDVLFDSMDDSYETALYAIRVKDDGIVDFHTDLPA